MPIPNRLILNSAHQALRGDLKVVDHASGFCLRAVREVLEHAFLMKPHAFYATYLSHRVERYQNDNTDPWARDMERSLRAQGMAVPIAERLPGDLVFQWKAAPTGSRSPEGHPNYYGHVGILLERDLIFENINPKYRPGGFTRQMLSLTPYDRWPYPASSVIRFDPYGHRDAVETYALT